MEVDLVKAKEILQADGLVGFPTETQVGLAANPFSKQAVAKLLEIKGREASKGIGLIADESFLSSSLLESNPLAKRLADKFWPGPLTIVFENVSQVCFGSDGLRLAEGICPPNGSVGIRVSSSKLCRDLASSCGGLVTATSANTSGQKPATNSAEFELYFKDMAWLSFTSVAQSKRPSTFIQIKGDKVSLLREGEILWRDIDNSLQ